MILSSNRISRIKNQDISTILQIGSFFILKSKLNMLFFRSITTKSNLPKYFSRALFSTETGTVKWYRYQKAYGFIVADNDSADVFVHRSAIAGSDSGDVSNPILKNDERVAFTRVDDNGRISAANVTFEDGTIIPTYRDGFEQKAIVAAKRKFGFVAFDAMEEGGDDEEILTKIKQAFQETKEKITRIEESKSSESN
jgi:cold shock protein